MDQLFWPGMNDMFLLFNNFSFFALVHPNSSKLSVGCHEVSDMWPQFEPDARFYLEAFSIFHLLITYNRLLNREFRDLYVSVQFLTRLFDESNKLSVTDILLVCYPEIIQILV